MTSAYDIHVLVPDRFGTLSVAPLADLFGRLLDDEDLETALDGASIDSIEVTPEQVARVRQLNATGNATAYWASD